MSTAAEMVMLSAENTLQARNMAVALEQEAAEAERLLRKVIVVMASHGAAHLIEAECPDVLEFLVRDVA